MTKVYRGGKCALDDVSLEVPDGSVYCLLGPNGAGKSTLIHLFLDFIRPTSGRTIVDNIVVQENPVVARRSLAYLPDQVELFESMTGFDNLGFFCQLGGQARDSRTMAALFAAVRLDSVWGDEKVGRYSRGMRQKLGLAILLGRGAHSFVLDEPTLGLDPQSGRDLVETIKEQRNGGASILLSTHDLMRASQISDYIGILQNGKLVREFSESEFRMINLEQTFLEYFDS
ncbi:MAG: ABC transporter ATP-binding protein [candidate division Zixibacteria bacterium]|nr:ABC transporter ATP-binding protein [candidate division Zixibacteria bacterium]